MGLLNIFSRIYEDLEVRFLPLQEVLDHPLDAPYLFSKDVMFTKVYDNGIAMITLMVLKTGASLPKVYFDTVVKVLVVSGFVEDTLTKNKMIRGKVFQVMPGTLSRLQALEESTLVVTFYKDKVKDIKKDFEEIKTISKSNY